MQLTTLCHTYLAMLDQTLSVKLLKMRCFFCGVSLDNRPTLNRPTLIKWFSVPDKI